ncbi:unnamed protein product [Lymnaea stagnalis]|uniref:Uncharacterized protein n=1 Tax=Lymnaea stagnalis TaxID=6523 RepID=A0AAV2HDV0_LYMST
MSFRSFVLLQLIMLSLVLLPEVWSKVRVGGSFKPVGISAPKPKVPSLTRGSSIDHGSSYSGTGFHPVHRYNYRNGAQSNASFLYKVGVWVGTLLIMSQLMAH